MLKKSDIIIIVIIIIIIISSLTDEDSEPILGEWFEGTLSPEDDQQKEPDPISPVCVRLDFQDENNLMGKKSRQPSNNDKHPTLVPDKREPDGVGIW